MNATTKLSSSIQPAKRPRAFAMLLLALFTSSCLSTNYTEGSRAPNGSTGNPLDGIITSSGGLILSRVMRSATDPSSSFDLVGDGSGAMGDICLSTSGSTDGTGASSCTCLFRYTTSAGAEQAVQVPTSYHESNLIRCSSSALPDDVSELRVAVFMTSTGRASNEITFRTAGNGTTLDLSDVASFSEVKRYQCKDSLYVPYQFPSLAGSSNVPYDPVLSESSKLSYPLNFYNTNPGKAAYSFVKAQAENPSPDGAGWLCPSKPNDSRYGMDLRVFSLGSDPTDGRVIYNPASNFNRRSSFHLARSATGAFKVPVRAYVAPNAVEIIGYGASPIPRVNGSGEDCSTLPVAIPAGYQWVKVWNFRGSLEDRKLPQSTKMANNTTAIWCAPEIEEFAPGRAFNTRCPGGGAKNLRIFGSSPTLGLCLQQSPAGGCSGAATGGVGCTTDGTDPLNLVQKADTSTLTTATGAVVDLDWEDLALGTDVYRRGNNNNAYCTSGSTAVKYQPALLDSCGFADTDRVIPNDRTPAMESLDGELARFDYLFVVSPETIMANDFRNDRDAAKPYTPYRFYSADQCQSPDPANPAPGDCLRSNTINYGVTFVDITQSGDGAGTDPGRLPAFPVCALQPL